MIARVSPFVIIVTVAGAMASMFVQRSALAVETLIAPGSTWRYLDDGSDQGTAWREPGFDDTSWAEGPAQLGYGDGDEATVVSFGPDPLDKYRTTYFRHAFDVAAPEDYFGITLGLLRDDGAVVYMNGVEVLRSNMPAGMIDYLTFAASTVGGSDEDLFNLAAVDPALLVVGENVLAIEVHQRTATSSDISLDVRMDADDGLPGVSRGPYLQRRTGDAMVVRWSTSVATAGAVHYGSAPDDLTETAPSGASSIDHEVVLTELTPGATYFYAIEADGSVIAGGDRLHAFATAPPAGPAVSTRVWVIGDSGTADANAAAVRDAYLAFTGARGTDVWLMLGDNAYDDGTDAEYQAAVFDMYPSLLRSVTVWPTLGNHDGHSADSPTESGPYYDNFTLPRAGEAGGVPSFTEAYYSFDHGDIHFVCLDSYDSPRGPTGAMMTWLEADLADTLARWIVAFWHHPPYTKGSHDSDDVGDSGARMRDMREIALPILEAHGVDLVLCGHSHSYERSFLVDGHYGVSSTLTPEMLIDAGDGRVTGDGPYAKAGPGLAPNEGAVYVVAGNSGKHSGGPLDHPVMFASVDALGSVVLDFEGDRLDLTCIDDNAFVRDRFTLLKGRVPDLDHDGTVGFFDIVVLLLQWGACPAGPADCPGDLDGNGVVDFSDLLRVLAAWS